MPSYFFSPGYKELSSYRSPKKQALQAFENHFLTYIKYVYLKKQALQAFENHFLTYIKYIYLMSAVLLTGCSICINPIF